MKVTSRLHVNHALFVLLGFVGLGNAFIPMNNHGGPRTHTKSSRGTSIQMGLRDRLSKTANMVPRISEKLIASVAELAEIAGEGGPVDIPDGVSAASAFDAAMVAEERANRGPVRLLSKENSFNLFSTFFFGVVLYGAQARYFKMAKKSVKDFGYQAVRVKNNKPKIQQLLKKTKARVGPYFWRDKMWARYCSAFLLSRPLEPTVFDTFAYTASLFRGPRRSDNRLATLALTAGTRFPNDKDRLTLLYLLVTRTFPDEEEVIEPLKTEMARIYAKMLKTEDQQEGLVEFYTKTQRWLENIYTEIVEKNGPQILNLKEKPSEWRELGLKEDVAQRIYMRYMRAEIQALIDRETAALDDQAAEEAKAKGTAIRYQDYYAVPKDDGLDEETRKERQINAEDDIEPDEIWEEEVLPPLQAHMSAYEQVMAEEERQKEAERKVMEMKIKKEEEVPMEAVDAHNFEINTQPLEEEEEEYYLEKGAFNDFEKEEEEEKEEEDPFKMIVVPKKEGLETLYKHVYKDFDGVDVTVDPATIDYLQKLYSASPDANASAEAGAAAPAAPAAPVAAAVAEPPAAAAAAAAAPFTVTPPAPPAPPAPEATATLVTPPPAAAPAAAAPPAEQLQPGTQPVAHECENCGYMLFVAPGREEVFFGDDFKCPSCGSEKDQFKTVEME